MLAGGYADLVAVEPSGRPAIIEVKLAANSEARRAVVSQILTYAAVLHGLIAEQFEHDVLGSHLRKLGYASLEDAARGADQEGVFDAVAFRDALGEHLATGSFRLVLVLDSAPAELVRLVGYLEAVSDQLVIDLITLSAFDASGSRILVPQRVEPERRTPDTVRVASGSAGRSTASPAPTDGAADFDAAIDDAEPDDRPLLRRLSAWAQELERERLVRLQSKRGLRGETLLLPRLRPEDVSLANVWNHNGVFLVLFRSVFARRAPAAIPEIEALIAPQTIGQGNSIYRIDDELLDALTRAYRVAAATQ